MTKKLVCAALALCMIFSAVILPVVAEGSVQETVKEEGSLDSASPDEPLAGSSPVTTEPPAEGTPPVTTEPPAEGTPPVTTEPPAEGTPPVTTEPPADTTPPVTTEPPADTTPPVTTEPPIAAPDPAQPVVTAQALLAVLFTYQGNDFLAQLELIRVMYPDLYSDVYAVAKEQVKAALITSAQMLYGYELIAKLDAVYAAYPDLYSDVYAAVFSMITDAQLDSLYGVYADLGDLIGYYDICATYRAGNAYVLNDSLLAALTDEQLAGLYDLYALKNNLNSYYDLCAAYRPNNTAFMYDKYLDVYLNGCPIDTVYAAVNALTHRQLDTVTELMEAHDLKLLREPVVSSYLSVRALVAWLYTQSTDVKYEVMNSLSDNFDPRLRQLYLYTLSEEDCDAWFMLIKPEAESVETVYLPPIIDAVSPSRRLSENTPSAKIYNTEMLYTSPMMMSYSLNATQRETTLEGSDKTEDVTGLNINKTARYNNDGSYTIKLETYTTGTVVTASKPVDVVLVLDVSGSMDDEYSQTVSYYTVNGVKNGQGQSSNRYYGFNSSSTQYYIKINDSYVALTYAGRDSGRFDYYYYNNGQNRVYVYPVLSNRTNTGNDYRQYTYSIVQFYAQGNNGTITKIEALKASARGFIDTIQNAVTATADIRIGIVTYASSSSINSSLIKIDTNGVASTSLKNSIGALNANGATRMDLGMASAQSMLNAGDGRDKVVILFTDGSPTSGNGFQSDVANATITTANTLKSTYGATVYTISILPGANTETPASNTMSSQSGSAGIINCSNQLMQLVSSNYKSPTESFSGNISLSIFYSGSVSYTGVIGTRQNGNYYLAASNIGTLTQIFENLASESVAPACALGESTVIKDLIAPQFNLPAAGDITAYTCDYTGNGTFSATEKPLSTLATSVNANGIVSVTGFNYDANCCVNGNGSIPTSGKKLIVYIKITPLDSFFGGNNVYTNSAAVIYSVDSNGIQKPLKAYPMPQVNIALNYEVEAQDQTIFYGENADKVVMLALGDAYIPDGDNNSHVNITYTITPEGSAEVIATKTVAAGEAFGSINWGSIEGLLPGTHNYIVTAVVTATGTGKASNGTELPGPGIQTSIAPCDTAVVTVLSGKITIEKKLAAGTGLENAGQRFIFKVTGPDGTTSYTLAANSTLTLTGLKKGSYTVTEDTNWSWRYDVVGQNGGTLSVGGKNTSGNYITDGGKITITNELTIPGRLSGEACAVNKFTGTAPVSVAALPPSAFDELMRRFTV